MSFLSSHRLHWGVHHELSDNFRLQLEKIGQEAFSVLPSASTEPAAGANPPGATPPTHEGTSPQLESLGP
jgi:hypothetical protein